LKLALLCSNNNISEEFKKNIEKNLKRISIDYFFEDQTPEKKEYNIIIDYNYIDWECSMNTAKYLIDNNDLNSPTNNSYYTFIPDSKLDLIQKIIVKEGLPIKICNFLNCFGNIKKSDNLIANELSQKDEFDFYEKIFDKLNKEAKSRIPNRSLYNLYNHFRNEDEIMENIIYDYIYTHQNEIFKNESLNYSLLTGKEDFVSIRIDLGKTFNCSDKIKEYNFSYLIY